MKIAVAGTGYVVLVTGVALANIGHNVTCVDIDEKKIEKMRRQAVPAGWPRTHRGLRGQSVFCAIDCSTAQ